MKGTFRSFFIVLVLLAACNPKPEERTTENRPSITYEEKTFRVESSGGCKGEESPCASYEVSYPQFTGLPAAVADSVLRKISDAVDTGNPELPDNSFKTSGERFVNDFERFVKEAPGEEMGWYYKAVIEVKTITDTLIVLTASSESFTGGAHGGYGLYFVNIDPASGKDVRLDDFFKPGYEEPLRKAGEEAFRAAMELPAEGSLAEAGYEFPDDRFALNDNYGFLPDGLHVVYNIYEIAPYVMGAQEIVIPYEHIREWMR